MITWFTAINPQLGEIVAAYTATEETSAANCPDGCFLVNGKFDASLGYFSGQDYIAYTQEQAQKKADRPSYPAHWSNESMSWADARDEERSWSDFRAERNRRLAACDWTQVPDAPVDHAAWAVYRQELRDLPDNTEDPRNPVWPTPPA